MIFTNYNCDWLLLLLFKMISLYSTPKTIYAIKQNKNCIKIFMFFFYSFEIFLIIEKKIAKLSLKWPQRPARLICMKKKKCRIIEMRESLIRRFNFRLKKTLWRKLTFFVYDSLRVRFPINGIITKKWVMFLNFFKDMLLKRFTLKQ